MGERKRGTLSGWLRGLLEGIRETAAADEQLGRQFDRIRGSAVNPSISPTSGQVFPYGYMSDYEGYWVPWTGTMRVDPASVRSLSPPSTLKHETAHAADLPGRLSSLRHLFGSPYPGRLSGEVFRDALLAALRRRRAEGKGPGPLADALLEYERGIGTGSYSGSAGERNVEDYAQAADWLTGPRTGREGESGLALDEYPELREFIEPALDLEGIRRLEKETGMRRSEMLGMHGAAARKAMGDERHWRFPASQVAMPERDRLKAAREFDSKEWAKELEEIRESARRNAEMRRRFGPEYYADPEYARQRDRLLL